MLSQLVITNYALIRNLKIDFSAGFTIITGQTGAGKSIMMDALGLLLGEKADSKVVTDKEEKTIVEAVFSNPDLSLKQLLESRQIEWFENELIVRREITPAGRSRAFINDTPVNLAFLSEVSGKLIDIHSQHSNIILSNSNNYLNIVDSFSGDTAQLAAYIDDFKHYISLRNRIKEVRERIKKAKENSEYISFRLEQLQLIKPKEGELEKLEKEYDILSDADRIKEELSAAYSGLEDDESSVVNRLGEVISEVRNTDLSLFDDADQNLLERLESMRIEAKDIAATLYELLERVEINPEKLEKITSRINLLYDSFKRFKVKDDRELVELYRKLESELNDIENGDEDLSETEAEARKVALSLKNQAEALTEIRKSGAGRMEALIKENALNLGLKNLEIKINIETGKLTADGQDIIDILVSFNKNHPLQPLSKVASGGEMARLMLIIKSILADCVKLPTIIFDEIDTGVSGEIAEKMGKMMKVMGDKMQVIAITHLPQVAAQGSSHFKVYKTDEGEHTSTHVRRLEAEERIEEIAAMLSGEEINSAAKENARILLGKNS